MAFEYTQKYTVDSAPTNLTDLRVDNLLATGIVSATTFVGNGSGLLGLAGVGSGVIVRSSGSLIGVASTLNFATNLNVTSISAGIVTISLPSSLTGPISVAGTVTATKFSGDGSGITGVTAVGSGVVLQNNGSPVGAAATLNFTTGLTVSAVSAGIATISGPVAFPSGTLMLFQQTAAPTGWTKQTTHNDKALRVVTGAASSGGSTAFTSVFASRTPTGSVDNTTLTIDQIPSHNHSFLRLPASPSVISPYDGWAAGNRYTNSTLGTSGDAGGGGAHNHGFTGTAMDFAVQYVDLIIASKD
jgi:hypothetical protein